MRYEVQTYTICEGWVNCWTDAKTGEQVIFDTYKEAEQEIKELIAGCIEAVEAGYMEDSPDLADFRIAEVGG